MDEILRRRSCASRSCASSANASPSCSGASTGWTERPSTTCAACSITSSGEACGSSAATAGRTTSAPAGWTTCWPAGHDVNVLVLDTEVYSNTGGQMSKATPLGAVAKFAAAGKTMPTKDLALQAIALANVYVARVAMGADPQQTLRAFREAEAYDGPSLIIAYSHCIAHGYDMRDGLDQQYRAVASGHWPLIRYDPVARAAGANPFLLDSPRPRMSLADYRKRELRFRALANSRPRRGGAPARARPAGGRPALADLRGDGHPRRRAVQRPTPARTGDGARDQLHGPCAAQPARGLGLAAVLHARRRPAAGGRRRRRGGAVLAVRGAAAGTGRADRPARRRARRELPRGARLLPGRRRGGRRTAPLSQPARARRRRRADPRDRQPQRRHARRAGPTTRARCRTPAPPRSS